MAMVVSEHQRMEVLLRELWSPLSILTLPSLPSTMGSPSATSPVTPHCLAPKVRLCPPTAYSGLQEGPRPLIPTCGLNNIAEARLAWAEHQASKPQSQACCLLAQRDTRTAGGREGGRNLF